MEISKKARSKEEKLIEKEEAKFFRFKLHSATKIVETIEVADTGRNNLIF